MSSIAQTTRADVVPALNPEQVIQEGLRRQEERSRDQQKVLQPQADELTPGAHSGEDAELPHESVCFVINSLALGGKDSARFKWLLDAATPYLHRCVGARGLSFIARTLDAKLRELGFVTTRVALPSQNLRDGHLMIHVEAGRLSGIRMVRADGPQTLPAEAQDDAWGTWRNAFPVSDGDLLNVRDLEQGVENMKRLPSQSVITRLEPGEASGSSVLLIERNSGGFKDRLRGGATVDNSGGSAMGRSQLSVYLGFDNPAGLNDVLTASFNTNVEQPSHTHRSQSASLSYSIPWGYALLTMSASNSRFAQYVQGTTVRFLSSGRSETAEAKLQRTMWRTASTKFGIYAAIHTRRAVSFLDDVEVIVQRRRTTNLMTGISYRQLFEQSSFDLDVGYRRGMSWRGAQDDLDSAALGGLTLRPGIWTVSSSFSRDFTIASRAVEYRADIRSQHTKDKTLSLDQMSIGGRSTVRGFDGDSVLLAENGWILRNQLTTPVNLLEGLRSVAFVALDYGRVWGPSATLLTGSKLAGLAVGLRTRWHLTQFEITAGAPVSRPARFGGDRTSMYFSMTQSF